MSKRAIPNSTSGIWIYPRQNESALDRYSFKVIQEGISDKGSIGMQYRKLGPIQEKVSALGFGIMRMPVKDGKIDSILSEEMLLEAYRKGVNYFDTAWPYHGNQSEPFLGEFLKRHGIREKVFIATKMPMWDLTCHEDLDRIFNKQLENLQTDYIDCYLFHALNKRYWSRREELNYLQWAVQKKAEGKIKYLGFSFHDQSDVFTDILQGFDKWDFCQIQLNYIDVEHQQGIKGLKEAAAMGLGVIIMEPLLGGKLSEAPPKIQKIWNSSETKRTPTDWALQWLWSKPEVSIILSGMSSQVHVKENLQSAAESSQGKFSQFENDLVDKARSTYRSLKTIGCTECRYCMPCPSGVDIPGNFRVYNGGAMFGSMEKAKGDFQWIPEKAKAGQCVSCGDCLEKCPQSIDIIEELAKVNQALA